MLASQILLAVCAICIIGGYISLIVSGFRQSIWWGLAILFVPFAGLFFAFAHWQKAKGSLLAIGCGIFALLAASLALPPNSKSIVEIAADYVRNSVVREYFGYFVRGMLMTINISFWAAIVSFVIGLVVAVLRVTPSGGLKIVATAFTEFFRNTPLYVQVLVFYFGLPKLGIQLKFNFLGFQVGDSFAAGTLALGLYTGAYVAEAIRSGLLAIPKGQGEAARSLGLSVLQTLGLVVLPQAIRLVLPPLGNLYSAMLKNSALLSSIGVADLMFQADFVNNRTFKTFEVYTAVVFLYLVLTLPMGWFVHWLEKKYNPLRAKTLRLQGAQV